MEITDSTLSPVHGTCLALGMHHPIESAGPSWARCHSGVNSYMSTMWSKKLGPAGAGDSMGNVTWAGPDSQ